MMANPPTRRNTKASTSNNSSSQRQRTSLHQAAAAQRMERFATKRERQDDIAIEISQPLLSAKLPKQEVVGVRTRAQKKAALREQEHSLMTQSIEGKAVLAVQEIIALVNSIKNVNGITIETITEDDMVFFTENMLRLQEEFMSKGINGYIDVGYHYTSSEHIAKIRQHGLLTRRDMNTHRVNSSLHGNVFGDGVYTASNPDSFANYGNTGVLVARLPGKMVRVRKYLGSRVYANTIIGDKMKDTTNQKVDKNNWPLDDANHECVLRSSPQCVPMIKYDERSRKTKTGKECIQKMEKGLQHIFDKYFNKGSQRTSYQDTEILSSTPDPPASASVAFRSRTATTRPSSMASQRTQGSNAPTSTAGNATTSLFAATKTRVPPRPNFAFPSAAASTFSSSQSGSASSTAGSNQALLKAVASTVPSAAAASSSSQSGSRDKNGTSSTAGSIQLQALPKAVASTVPSAAAANSSSQSGSGDKNGTLSTARNIQSLRNAVASTPNICDVFVVSAFYIITALKLHNEIVALNMIIGMTMLFNIAACKMMDVDKVKLVSRFNCKICALKFLLSMPPVMSKVQANDMPIKGVVIFLIASAAAFSDTLLLAVLGAFESIAAQKAHDSIARKTQGPKAPPTTGIESVGRSAISAASGNSSVTRFASTSNTMTYKAPKSLPIAVLKTQGSNTPPPKTGNNHTAIANAPIKKTIPAIGIGNVGTGGLFGAPAPAPAFGAPAPAPAFGAAPAPATGALFGAPAAPAPAGGLFGATPAPAPSAISTALGNSSATSDAIHSTPNTLTYTAPKSLSTGIPLDAVCTPDPSCNMRNDCAICWDALGNSNQCAMLKCGHIFHTNCVQQAFQSTPKCPVCRKSIGAPVGKCPSGTMTTTITSARCSGFQEDSIVISYAIPVGKQMAYHDNPGTSHSGKRTTAFIPNNSDGQVLLKRLKYAFLHGLTFTVGTSMTTGRDNQCTWASIHHKTNRSGGVRAHGFPDPGYFKNCNDELDALGVPRADSLDENGRDV